MAEFRDTRVDLPVGTMQVWRGGAGPVVVALHSSGGEGPTPALDDLADDHEVIIPLLPGFGESEGAEHIDAIDDDVFVLLDLWDELELDRPVVTGLSLGGWLALELACRHPERVGSLVLVNSVGLYLPEAPIAELFGRPLGELAEILFYDQAHPTARLLHDMDDFTGDVGRMVDIPPEIIVPIWRALGSAAKLGWDPYFHNPKLPGRLRRADVPALVIAAAHDGLVPMAHAERLVELLPDAHLEVVENAAHWAPLERGDEIARLTREFVEKVG